MIRPARFEEHAAIMRVAKQTKWTKDFSNALMFSSAEHYAKGWVLAALLSDTIVGFASYRVKVRQPETVLYFVGVDPKWRGRGIAWQLIERVMERSTHKKLTLKCARDNPVATEFYRKHLFATKSSDPKYWIMERDFDAKRSRLALNNRR
jgi:ribosomal protein S18 acetylase RimI-like enzyme